MILAGSSAELSHALEVAPAGETLQLHAGTFIAPRGGFVVSRSLRLEGTHPLRNHLRGGSIIEPASPDDHGIVIPDGIENVTLTDLIVRGTQKPGTGDGIHMVQTRTLGCIELRNLFVWGCGRDGIHLECTNGSIDWLVIDGCMSSVNGRHGLFVRHSVGANIRGGFYAHNGRCGMVLDEGAAAAIQQLSIEGNQETGPASDYEPQLWLRGGAGHNVEGCRFEDWARTHGARAGITVENGVGVRIVGCSFVQPDTAPSRGILFRNKCSACEVGLNTWRRVTRPTDIDTTCTGVEIRDPQAFLD